MSGSTTAAFPSPQPVLRQLGVIALALSGLIGVAGLAAAQMGWRGAALALIGGFSGLALYHASFGFTAAWRRMLRERRGVGLRAQIVMLAIACALFFPLLAAGEAFGRPVAGFVFPIGIALALGAFLFGVGMQVGGGCGSGTLYALGGGSTRMLVTLAAFVAGSTLAAAGFDVWAPWPALPAVSAPHALGWPAALALALGLCGLAYLATLRLESARHGSAQPLGPVYPARRGAWLTGPWPLLLGALALVGVNLATLLVAGRPWGITAAFPLWGSQLLGAAGVDVAGWSWWRDDPAIASSVFADVTSVMDFGLMLGAAAAAGLAGRFAPSLALPWRSLAAAILGGLLMGIGARLATGCNIGAFFSGVASGSPHALVWLACAIPGNALGVRLRPLFRLD